jgi:hypothetical protein
MTFGKNNLLSLTVGIHNITLPTLVFLLPLTALSAAFLFYQHTRTELLSE